MSDSGISNFTSVDRLVLKTFPHGISVNGRRVQSVSRFRRRNRPNFRLRKSSRRNLFVEVRQFGSCDLSEKKALCGFCSYIKKCSNCNFATRCYPCTDRWFHRLADSSTPKNHFQRGKGVKAKWRRRSRLSLSGKRRRIKFISGCMRAMYIPKQLIGLQIL